MLVGMDIVDAVDAVDIFATPTYSVLPTTSSAPLSSLTFDE
jgi:hypothetical protein